MTIIKQIENDLELLLPVKSKDTIEIQEFLFKSWNEFFNTGTRETVLLKRKDLQDPETFYKDHNGNFWCLRIDGNVIATIGVHEILYKQMRVGFLRRFVVDKQFRNKGLGSKILQFVENYSYEKGWKYLMFGVDESMERNKRFYFRNGYEEFYTNIPPEILDDNDRWYLRKKLRA